MPRCFRTTLPSANRLSTFGVVAAVSTRNNNNTLLPTIVYQPCLRLLANRGGSQGRSSNKVRGYHGRTRVERLVMQCLCTHTLGDGISEMLSALTLGHAGGDALDGVRHGCVFGCAVLAAVKVAINTNGRDAADCCQSAILEVSGWLLQQAPHDG
jgi:hypothetical protein